MNSNQNIFDAEKFINIFLIEEIKRLIENRFYFFAFILICLGIEYLGSFYDNKELEKEGQSKKRFKNGLRKLFKDEFYKRNQKWLFKNLRGNLIHQIRPSKEILLTSNRGNDCPIENHLMLKNG